ncbi:hypothetical protein [Niallia sp. NCCP-28]|uniref:hypothetical protein n=1 Tax=Niallia sp. NCCP-28 TaxID=2934712 RepID=UPI0020832F57|nr:hypothetical protein [Niallia sp. NCCP-28]GKU82252.1 putative membrane protein YuaF [Niallia sp. NCCP-28]
MELFGFSITSIYLLLLIISGICILVTLVISDVFSAELGILNPTVILAFLTIFSASGFLMEKYALLNSIAVLGLSSVIAIIVALCLHFFVLIPLSSAEESLVYDDESLKGRVGKVITAIPKDGFGEILIESYSGNISKTAAGFYNEEIASAANVVIIEVKNNIAYVVLQEDL